MALKLKNVASLLKTCLRDGNHNQTFPKLSASQLRCGIHTTTTCNVYKPSRGLPENPTRFTDKNQMVYPPQQPGEKRRPAWVCHMRGNIKYSPLKLWYIACMIRGMSIDEALKQLSFLGAKGAPQITEVLLEAQELAVKQHNVEYKSNLWVAESFVGKGITIMGYRRHARARFGRIDYRYAHYFVRLEEGEPPEHYYEPEASKDELLKEYIKQFRERRIDYSL